MEGLIKHRKPLLVSYQSIPYSATFSVGCISIQHWASYGNGMGDTNLRNYM